MQGDPPRTGGPFRRGVPTVDVSIRAKSRRPPAIDTRTRAECGHGRQPIVFHRLGASSPASRPSDCPGACWIIGGPAGAPAGARPFAATRAASPAKPEGSIPGTCPDDATHSAKGYLGESSHGVLRSRNSGWPTDSDCICSIASTASGRHLLGLTLAGLGLGREVDDHGPLAVLVANRDTAEDVRPEVTHVGLVGHQLLRSVRVTHLTAS